MALRRVAAILADWLRYDLLLHEICATESDPRLLSELERMTAFVEPGAHILAKAEGDAGDKDDGLDDEEAVLSVAGEDDEGEL